VKHPEDPTEEIIDLIKSDFQETGTSDQPGQIQRFISEV
jgi:hypothetical protein